MKMVIFDGKLDLDCAWRRKTNNIQRMKAADRREWKESAAKIPTKLITSLFQI